MCRNGSRNIGRGWEAEILLNSKRKGSQGERELLEILSHVGQVERNDQRYTGGAGNPDIRLSAGGRVYHVEVKRVEKLNLHAAIKQAEADAASDTIPIVVHRRNREEWYVNMRLKHFIELITEDRS